MQAPGRPTLVLALFLLRQSGQGLMSHVAITSTARYFDLGRGRAIATASLGFSAGEVLLPLGVAMVAVAGVDNAWIVPPYLALACATWAV